MGEKSIEGLFNKKNLLQNARSKTNLPSTMRRNYSILKSERIESSIIKDI